MKKIQQKLASEIYSHIDLEKEAEGLVDPAFTPAQFLDALVDAKQFFSAVIFLAHALPKREAVWWACLCAKSTLTSKSSQDDVEALKSAEQWVFQPTEDNRRQAEALAIKTDFVTPSSWAAMAAFWSGGSITAADEPPVPPSQYLYANAVAGAVNLSATLDPTRDTEKLYNLFLEQGKNIADGGNGDIAAA